MNPTLLIITGAASGIGLELASYFAKLSTNLILIDTDEKTLKESFQENEQISLIAADITQEDTWNKAIDLAKGRFTPISHLINCAGVIQPGFLLNYKISDIGYHLDINTKGSILGTTLIAREMKNQEFGHIINVTTGYPSGNYQVGLLTDSCFLGDILATGLFAIPSNHFLVTLHKIQ